MWEVEYTDSFGVWWDELTEGQQVAITAVVGLLEERGPALTRPFADSIKGSRHPNMRELRVQHAGAPLRLLYAFDPRRVAILLVGGDKSGDNRWYDIFVPIADTLYDEHLREIESNTSRTGEKKNHYDT